MTRLPIVGFASTEGGCLHYRAEIPATMLAARGYHTVWTDDLIVGTEGGFGFPAGAGSPECEPDVIVLAGGWPSNYAALFIEAARANGQAIVADCDDWPWLPPENPHTIPNGGELKLAALRAADAVTCSTAYLRAELAERGIAAELARNVIAPARYTAARAANTARAGRHELVVAYRGIACGFHDADIAQLRGVLPDGPVYVHAGADPRGATFEELTGTTATGRPARPFEEDYPRLLTDTDLALIPFADRAFSHAKSAIAGLEWAAAGVAWIGAGHHPELVRLDLLGARASGPRHTRALIDRPGQWAHRIAELTDPAARAELHTRQHRAMLGHSIRAAERPGTTAHAAACAWSHAVDTALARAATGARRALT